ncbi:MAG: cysteine desulfurase family protein [Acidimicrobiia bacterium]
MSDLYLDHAATTPMRAEARDAMLEATIVANANASGLHGAARAAKNALEAAREEAASLLGASRPLDVVFTSGGTEADNLAIGGVALSSDRRSIVCSAIEHDAVLRTAMSLAPLGYRTARVGVDAAGLIDPNELGAIVDHDTAIVSVMAANNEIGTMEPIASIVDAVKGRDPTIPVHTDAVQAFVSEPITVAGTGVDLLSLSGHKFGGPKGVGLLVVAPGVAISPVIHGGGQEAGRRSGTSNVPGIVGMVAAMREVAATRGAFEQHVRSERDEFEAQLRTGWPAVIVNAADAPRMPQHSHVRFPGVLAETLLIRLDRAGIFAAAGSACQSGAVEPSHVLVAMGMDGQAAGECVRFTFGWDTPVGAGREAASRVHRVLQEMT